MFFLLRMTFWLGLVLALLPSDKTPESDKLPQVGAYDAVSAATAAMSDMAQFCTRQPAACTVGGQAAEVITHRAQAGARKVYQFVTDKTDKTEKNDKIEKADKAEKPGTRKPSNTLEAKRAPDHTGSIERGDEDVARLQDTLTSDDLQIEWQPPS